MSNVEKISIALPSEMIETIKNAVDAGEYATTSEAIRDALRRWDGERLYQRAVKTHGAVDIQRAIKEGIESLDRGEGISSRKLRAELTGQYKAMTKRKVGKRRA
jgi:antitoxin ParD1/3/4